MSIENFFSREPNSVRKGLENKKRSALEKDGLVKGTHQFMWDIMMNEGRGGLSALSEIAKATNLNDDKLKPYMKEHGKREVMAIVLGAAFFSLEDTFVNRSFDYLNFIYRINYRLSGTLYPPFSTAGAEAGIEKIEDSKWREMVAAAKADKSLASFFSAEGFSLLPKEMRAFLIREEERFDGGPIDRYGDFFKQVIRQEEPAGVALKG